MPAAKKTAAKRKTNGDRTIKVLKKANPRRRGTGAHKAFEAMIRATTVENYYKKFKDRKAAAAYLSTAKKDGLVKLI